MKSLLSGFEQRPKLLITVLLLSTLLTGLAYYIAGRDFAISVLIPLLTLVLTITKNVWSSDNGQTKVALASIGAVLLLVAGTGLSHSVADILLEPVYNRIPALKVLPLNVPVTYFAMILGSVAILIVNYFMRDNSAMNKHPSPLEKEFPEPEYKERLKRFCRVLDQELIRIETEGNWSSELFVPLDAEIEVQKPGLVSKKRKDLISALKIEKKAKTILVIGQPGSGKSVALRKLCRDLLREVEKAGKVPVYINLKEWTSEEWTQENPPSIEEFHKFVLRSLKNQGDRYFNDFLNTYFDHMVETGRVFFIFDSFDEIPALLEPGNTDWIVDQISTTIDKYLNGAHESRGIVATRPYKRPSNLFSADAIIHILPFSESKVIDALKKYPSVTVESRRELLTTRRDLLPVAKNPFYCALIVNFLNDNNGSLPANRSELFKSFIESRLAESSEKIAERGISLSEVQDTCNRIARLMFDSDTYGFEYPIAELKNQLGDFEKLEKTIEILVYSKIGRHSNSDKTLFTFTHKRFAEYFAVLTLLGNGNRGLLSDILEDGKWRDTLVLLSEIEEESESKEIALYTWNQLISAYNSVILTGKTFSMPTIHGLRFLRDAYLSRRQCVSHIQSNLGLYVWTAITRADTILEKKISLECVGLLEEGVISETISEAFRQNISWLNETALKSCFYLNSIPLQLRKNLVTYLDSIPIFSFIRKYKEIRFVLQLSDNFTDLTRFSLVRLVDTLLIVFLYAIYTVYNPFVVLLYLVALLLRFDNPWHKLQKFSVRGVLLLRFEAVMTPLTALGITNIINMILSPTGFQIIKWDTPWPLVIFNILILVPWYQIYYYLYKFKAHEEVLFGITEYVTSNISDRTIAERIKEHNMSVGAQDRQKEISSPVKWLLVWALAITLLGLIISLLPPNIKAYGYVLFGLILGSGYIAYLPNLFHRFQDWRKLRSYFAGNEFTRESIAGVFYGLKSEAARLKFVNRLGSIGVIPAGEWPDKIPNIGNDEASSRLAQLEENWQNLDR